MADTLSINSKLRLGGDRAKDYEKQNLVLAETLLAHLRCRKNNIGPKSASRNMGPMIDHLGYMLLVIVLQPVSA